MPFWLAMKRRMGVFMKSIEITNLTKKYGNKTAVDNLSLSIEQGELFGLLGVNGAGKTTTIKMLCGLCSATSGDATLQGFSISKEPTKIKEIINVSPQETAIAPNLSVRENLEFIAGIYGANKKEQKIKAQNFIKDFHLEEFAAQKAKTLSGGWQRKLSIGMALITEPKILFLDEPTLGLDVLARRELWKFISALKGKITIILTTHYLEEAEALSDRIAIMANGKLMALGTSEELKKQANSKNFEDAFVKLALGEETGMEESNNEN